MQYLITALLSVISITIGTLVTQMRGRGLIIRIILGGGMILYQLIISNNTTKKWLSCCLLIGVWLITGIITQYRIRHQDNHCHNIPTTIKGKAIVTEIRKKDESYIISQENYKRLYKTSQGLHPGQEVGVNNYTKPIKQCMITYTHRDIGRRRIQQRLNGGEFDYDRRLTIKEIDGHIQGTITLQNNNKTTNIKQILTAHINTLFPIQRTAGRVGGTLIGSKEMIAKSDYDLLMNSGLVHLIVVSGGNLALLITIMSVILFFIPLRIRQIIIGCGLIWYVHIVGTDSSVLRALIMALVTIYGLHTGRKRSFGGMISLTTIILLWYQPMLIYDIGLRLSLGAVMGIYLTYHEISRLTIERKKSGRQYRIRQILLMISASIGARFGTLPIIIRQFGSANITSIIANSIIGIIASVITVLEIIIVSTAQMMPQLILTLLIGLTNYLVQGVYMIADITVKYGVWIGVSNQQGFWITIGVIGGGFITLYHHIQTMRIKHLLEIK